MLETLDMNATLDSETYEERKPLLQIELNRVQRELHELGLGVIVLFEGWDFSGKPRCAQFLTEPLDPRGHKVHVMYPPSEEERRFPFAQRYWLRLPARGKIAFFLRSWYYHVLDERVQQKETARASAVTLEEIRLYEKTLADDGFLILKFWLEIDEAEQKKRRHKAKESAGRYWRAGPDDPKQHKRRKEYAEAVEEMIATTSTDYARWYTIPANDSRFARVSIATTFINRVKDAIYLRRQPAPPETPPPDDTHVAPPDHTAGLTLHTDPPNGPLTVVQAKKRLEAAHQRVRKLQYECVDHDRSVVVVFEGWDAGGKGGAIRRLSTTLDPRYYEVHPIAAPRGEEADRHYLWRFWQRVPAKGHWSIFDRSWYGRVMVERVEGFATVPQWRRAYTEINDFEAALHGAGCILIKFWMNVSYDEQLRRFEERQNTEYKRYKITDEDWRNREKWPEYEKALVDMIQRTSTPNAPWTVVPGNDKNYARVFVLETVVERIASALSHKHASSRR